MVNTNNADNIKMPIMLKASLSALFMFTVIIEMMFMSVVLIKPARTSNPPLSFTCTYAYSINNCIAGYWRRSIGYTMSALTDDNYFKIMNDYCIDKYDKNILCSQVPDTRSMSSLNLENATHDQLIQYEIQRNDYNARNAYTRNMYMMNNNSNSNTLTHIIDSWNHDSVIKVLLLRKPFISFY